MIKNDSKPPRAGSSEAPQIPPGGEASGRFKIRPNQGPSQPAVVALRMEDLTLWVAQRVAKMSRAHKFTVGDRLLETCLDVTASLVEASFTRDKRALLLAASKALTRARVLVRMAQRLRLLSEAQASYFSTQSTEIGRMLGGWARSQPRAHQKLVDAHNVAP